MQLFGVAQDAAVGQQFWQIVDSPSVDAATRFALAQSVIALPNSSLRVNGYLDTIALEAAQSALASGAGTSLAAAAVREPSLLSNDALHTILALVCTAIHDQVDDLLNGSDAAVPIDALEIFASHAEVVGAEVIKSDVQVQALVAVHHLTHLLPRNSLETFEIPSIAARMWTGVEALQGEEKTALDGHVERALADMLGQVTCRIQ